MWSRRRMRNVIYNFVRGDGALVEGVEKWWDEH